MNIVVLDGYTLNPGDLDWDGLKKLGNLTVYDRTETIKVISRMKNAEIVFTNKTVLSSDIINACPDLKFIGVLATGYNVVDTAAAKARKIPVCNIPTYGTSAVSQFVFALLLHIYHHVGDHNQAVKNGEWATCKDFCFWNFPLVEMKDKTMGIIGYGRIGQETGRIAAAFGMKVLAFDEYPDKKLENENMKYVSMDELLAASDVVTLHCPLFDSNKGMIKASSIAKMKDGVILINTSRGPLVVEQDLASALRSGKVAWAAVDVVSSEPIKNDNPLLGEEHCIITPHIAWAPKESRKRLMDIAVENLAQFIAGHPVNVVNPQEVKK